jgi:hypothetical protein
MLVYEPQTRSFELLDRRKADRLLSSSAANDTGAGEARQ